MSFADLAELHSLSLALCLDLLLVISHPPSNFRFTVSDQMGDKKDEDLYHNFSRKDLQGLCKKYGLPANKTNSEMATSLILYLERRNLTSKAVCNGTESNPRVSSSASELQFGVHINSASDDGKDCFGNGRFTNPQAVQPCFLHNFATAVTSDKGWGKMQNLPPLPHRGSSSGACLPENAFSSVEVSSPTFQFDVSCEDGIQLHVDLNSSPSDWVQIMKTGVQVCHDLYKNKPQSIHQELGRLCCLKQKKGTFHHSIDSRTEINDSHVEDGFCPSTIMKGGQFPAESDGQGCLYASALDTSINSADRLEHLRGDQAVLSSRHESVGRQYVCCTNSRIGDGEMPIDSDVNGVTQIDSSCNFAVNRSLCGAKCSGMLENQNRELDSEICENSPLPVQPIEEFNWNSTTISLEMRECTVAPQNKGMSKKDVSVDLTEQAQNLESEQGELANVVSFPFNKDAIQIQSVEVEIPTNAASCHPCMYGGSVDRIDPKHSLDTESGRSATLSEVATQSNGASYCPCIYSGSVNQIDLKFSLDNNCGGSATLSEPNHESVVLQTLSEPNHEPVLMGIPWASRRSKETPSSPSKKFGSLDLAKPIHTVEKEMSALVYSNEFDHDKNEKRSSMAANRRKEVSFSHCITNGCSDSVVLKQNSEMDHGVSINLTEHCEGTCKDRSISFAEQLERCNAARGMESSDCLNLGYTMEKSCSSFDDSESVEERKRKSQYNNVNSDVKILRSQKQFAGEIHASPRRSMHLYSK
ncbi:hypothetical protein Nepgr_010514 [Nepenthes gracilis]|uniref:SAP domain-containing protein n=1 Tax=Nepenthes gracilis TaxID=150966 RepID=A0AAD3SDI5_NEPGR|nr:hypothetical protein Nepgr_010514 [Nepenthes gracilis]